MRCGHRLATILTVRKMEQIDAAGLEVLSTLRGIVASRRREKKRPRREAEALCWIAVLVAPTFVTNDHVAVRAAVTDRYVAASAIVAVAFMPMTPVVTTGADAGRADAGMSPR
jgi:hypothetical protein